MTFGCSKDFEKTILDEGLKFYEINISKNKNIGTAEDTVQPESEKERLEEFFQATRLGAVETLIAQSHHRKADMLYDPRELMENIETIYYGKEMIVLPFSSDQFNIVYDMEKNKLSAVLDPNNFTKEDLSHAFKYVENIPRETLKYWRDVSRRRGPDYATKIILDLE